MSRITEENTMLRIAKFEKVSVKQFVNDWLTTFPQQSIEQAVMAYEHIQLPRRATSGSAGYDFFALVGFELPAGGNIKIPTGVRAIIEEGWVLTLYPRSGLGFKYRFQLDNSVGVIDSDYAYSDNEGHIFIKVNNDSNEGKKVELSEGTGFAHGVFLPYGITLDDAATIAKDAIATQYGLNNDQTGMLVRYTGEEDESTYEMVDSRPLVNMFFHLMQKSGEWQEKDGVYVVTINLLDGAVEDIYYDNTLMGNG